MQRGDEAIQGQSEVTIEMLQELTELTEGRGAKLITPEVRAKQKRATRGAFQRLREQLGVHPQTQLFPDHHDRTTDA